MFSLEDYGRSSTLGLLAVLCFAFPTAAEVRTWTDVTGAHKIEAEFVEFKGGKVKLKTPTGKMPSIPIAKLSVDDRRHVAKLVAQKDAGGASSPEEEQLKEIAQSFFEGLRSDDRTALAPLLSLQARTGLQSGASPIPSLPKPDEGRSIRVGKAIVQGEQGNVSARLQINEEPYAVKLALVKQRQGWGVTSLEAKQPDGTTKLIEFAVEGASDNPSSGGDVVTALGDPQHAMRGIAIPFGHEMSGQNGAIIPGGDGERRSYLDQLTGFALLGIPSERSVDGSTKSRSALEQALTETDAVLASRGEAALMTLAAQRQLVALGFLAFSDLESATTRAENLNRLVQELELKDARRDAACVELRLKLMGRPSNADAVPLLEKASEFFSEGIAGPHQTQLALVVASSAERLSTEDSAPLLTRLGVAMAGTTGPAAIAGVRLQAAAKRLALLGNEVPLKGVLLNGSPLDPSKFAGKVVLVAFWKSGLLACREELRNVAINYQKFSPKGFEVVGVSLDQDTAALKRFVQTDNLPWAIVAERHPDAEAQEKLSDLCGVIELPTALLISREGKVTSLDALGTKLGQLLEEQL